MVSTKGNVYYFDVSAVSVILLLFFRLCVLQKRLVMGPFHVHAMITLIGQHSCAICQL